MTTKPTDHPNYNPNDYAYLVAKGWTDEEIIDRWNAERNDGKGPVTWEGEWKVKFRATVGQEAQ